jgi:Cu(I)/Ag(I) efflux system membrane fusion protein
VLGGVKEGEQVVVAANFLIDAESNLKAAVGGFGHAAHGEGVGAKSKETSPANTGASGVGHKAEGKIDAIDAKQGTVSIAHGPIASVKWPAMTMEFKAANSALLQDLKPGTAVAFEFVERQPGEWVVTGIQPAAAAKGSASMAPAKPHSGH